MACWNTAVRRSSTYQEPHPKKHRVCVGAGLVVLWDYRLHIKALGVDLLRCFLLYRYPKYKVLDWTRPAPRQEGLARTTPPR